MLPNTLQVMKKEINKKCKKNDKCSISFGQIFERDPVEEERREEKEESEGSKDKEKTKEENHLDTGVECNKEAYLFL